MPRISLIHLLTLTAIAFSLLWVEPSFAETESEKILPDTAQAILVISNIGECANEFEKTDIAALLDNPDIEIFTEDLREKIEAKLKDKGLRAAIDDQALIEAFNGEFSISIIQPAPKKMAVCFLANVKGNHKVALELLADGRERIKAAVKRHKLEGGKVVEFKEGDIVVKGISLPRERWDAELVAYSTIVGDWLIAADDKATIVDLIKRAQAEKPKDSLKDDATFKEVMSRFETGQKYGNAYLKWYVKPFGLAEAIKVRAVHEVGARDIVGAMKDHGYGAIKAAGGKVGFSMDDYEIISQNFIYVPTKDGKAGLQGAAEALNFRNNGSVDMKPEPWILKDSSSYFAIAFDIKNAFYKSIPLMENLGLQKDAIKIGLDNFKVDEQGPKIDIERDILDQLGHKIAVATSTKLPVGINSERLLLTVKIKGDEAVTRKTIDKWLAFETKSGGIEKLDYKSFTIWAVDSRARVEGKNNADEKVEIEGVPGVGGGVPGVCTEIDSEPRKDPAKEGEKRLLTEPLVKTQVFTVAHGHLIITNSIEHAKEIINAGIDPPAKTIRDQEQFVRINDALNELLPGADSLRRFVRLDESYRLTYELMREGKLPESNSLLGAVMKAALKDEGGEPIELKVDGKLLPENFDKEVAPFLGSFGWGAKTLEDGWLITGVMVSNRDKDE